ncbi:MAG: hypothetical protein KatS3mg105_3211 [Gemmatales bacterium]|nr:MAG: hypothetical protein KatS3mg105_3211 [Gemmatales bacterium]
MRLCTLWAATVAAACLVAAPILGQQQKKPVVISFGLNSPVSLLKVPDVQKDLNLSEEQVAKIKEMAAAEEKARANAKGQGLQKLREVLKSHQEKVASLLNDEQKKRLEQLQAQQRGIQAFSRQLEFTREQRQKIGELRKELYKEVVDLARNGKAEEARKKAAEVAKKLNDEIYKVLTPEQQKKWKEMTGKPFKGELPRVRGIFGNVRPVPINPNIQPQKIQPPPKKVKPNNIKRIQLQIPVQ